MHKISSLLRVEGQTNTFVLCFSVLWVTAFPLPLDLVCSSPSYSRCKLLTDWYLSVFVMGLFTVVSVPLVSTCIIFLFSVNLKCFIVFTVICPLRHWSLWCMLVDIHIFEFYYCSSFIYLWLYSTLGLEDILYTFSICKLLRLTCDLSWSMFLVVLGTMDLMCCWMKYSLNVYYGGRLILTKV